MRALVRQRDKKLNHKTYEDSRAVLDVISSRHRSVSPPPPPSPVCGIVSPRSTEAAWLVGEDGDHS